MIKIERLTNGIEDEVNRLADGPTLMDLEHFEIVLDLQFVATQEAVHVITGSLRSSGRASSNMSEGTWEGEITYGGPSTGIHNPVDYAEYERERGNFHDFLAAVKIYEEYYVRAMNSFLGG
jgi:hypothetical protein